MTRVLRTGMTFAMIGCLLGCKEEARKQLYFPDLLPPLGVGKVQVVSDVSSNPASGGEVTVLVAVQPDIDRDELDRLMSSFYRQTRTRQGFQGGGNPRIIDIRFFTSEGQAKTGGDGWLARVHSAERGDEPVMTNKQKMPLLKWAKQALGKMPEFTADLQPRILADPTSMSLEVTVPFVAHDGTGKYVEKLSNEKATTEWSGYTRTLFDKIPQLRKLTFIGKHLDKAVLRIWLTREQYTELNLQDVEEKLGAFQGQFIELILGKSITEKAVEEKVKKQRRKVYRETLARLPEEQVHIAEWLR